MTRQDMNPTAINVRTATGTVHSLTVGRTYKQYGVTCTNKATSQIGRADCGAQTSSAASLTDEPVNCGKCSR